MFKLDGKTLQTGTAFTHNDIQYPANWLNLSTLEEKQTIGITEIAEQPRPDDRYYWVTDNGDGTYSTTPKDLTSLKVMATNQVNQTAGSILAPSDYMVIKAFETTTPIDATWNTWRNGIRSQALAQKTAIAACTTVEQLIALTPIVWANDPNYVAPAEVTA
jgi:hypothetical protein